MQGTQREVPPLASRTVEMALCSCPPGRFTMSSPGEGNAGSYRVTPAAVELTRGFWLGKYPVTQGQYRRVTGVNPSFFSGNDCLPVETVSWDEAVRFCQRLTELERPRGDSAGVWEYGLPTEAQWEYGRRAGTMESYEGDLDRTGRYWKIGGGRSHQVGRNAPNAWGLHDMGDNVWEWCADWYSSRLEGGADPSGPPAGADRVDRGGNWTIDARVCRSTSRDCNGQCHRNRHLGFRVALAACLAGAPPCPGRSEILTCNS